MAFSLDITQEEIIAHLEAELAQPLHEQAIPDIETVRRNEAGEIDPYIAFQFGMPVQQGATSFAGAMHHDYVIPIYLQVISPDAALGRRIANKIVRVFLGKGFSWAGEVRQRSGGPMFPMVQSTGATEAYAFPLSFGLSMQLSLEA